MTILQKNEIEAKIEELRMQMDHLVESLTIMEKEEEDGNELFSINVKLRKCDIGRLKSAVVENRVLGMSAFLSEVVRKALDKLERDTGKLPKVDYRVSIKGRRPDPDMVPLFAQEN